MAIIFSQGTQINSDYSSGSSNPRINLGRGNIVQTVYTTYTGEFSSTNSTFIEWARLDITIRPGNQVLAEYFMKQREDNGQGTWNLARHQIRKVSGTAATLINSGFHGGQCNTIYQGSLHILYNPGSGGTHTFTAEASGWSGTMYFNRSGGNGDGQAWLRLSEIALA